MQEGKSPLSNPEGRRFFLAPMKIAMAITVRNEEALLRINLLYHHYLGVDRCYVFSDGTTDDTLEQIQDLPFVRIYDSVPFENYKERPEIKRFIENLETHFAARQNLHTYLSTKRAREEGMDWILALDTDELAVVDLKNSYKGQLKDLFQSFSPKIEMVNFPTVEILQRNFEYKNVFAEETLFKNTGFSKKRHVYDPIHDRTIKIKGFYGHTRGKSALKLSVDAVPLDSHDFVSPNNAGLASMNVGTLLHYHCYSYSDFIKKFRNFKNHSDRYLNGGKVEYQKILWRNMVNSPQFSDEYLRGYYQKWVMFTEEEIRKLKKTKQFGVFPITPALVQVSSVKHAFSEISKW